MTDLSSALSTRMIERIFCGAVTRGSAQKEGRMSYTEFVWFLLSEEVETSFSPFFIVGNLCHRLKTFSQDKRHPTAIEYWFRCMDLDGDGLLSMWGQKSKSPISWNISSQVWTWVLLWRAAATDGAARNRNSSLRRLSLPGSVLSLFLVLSISYHPLPSDAGHDQAVEQARHHLEGLEAVQDDPGLLWHLLQLGEIPRPRTERPVCHPEGDRRGWKRGKNPILYLEILLWWQICYFSSPQMSDWDRFAAEEYELLVAEEGTAEPMDDMWVFEGSSIQTWILFRLSSNSKTHLTCWLCRCYDDGGDPGRGGGVDQSSLDSEMVTHDSWDRVTMVLELWDGHPSTCDNWIDSKNHSQEYVFEPEANPDSVLWHWMWCGMIWSSTEVWKWIETLEHKSSEGQLCSNCLTVKKPRLSLKSSQKCSKSNSCEA